MKILFYSTKDFERPYIETCNTQNHGMVFTSEPLSLATVEKAKSYDAVSIFTNDDVSAPVIKALSDIGVKFIAVRAAGFDNVDIASANEQGIMVANVPDYSPNAIAEHTVLLMLALSRKIVLAQVQAKRKNFTLDNLIGFDLNKKTVGVIGTGRIGKIVCRILHGLGCTLIAYDPDPDQTLMNKYDVHYVELGTIYSLSDIITIHLPLNKQTRHMINEEAIAQMQRGVMLINTARGAIVNTHDVLAALDTGKVGYFGADVYENEKGIFFFDHSSHPPEDATLNRLIDHPNVIVTPHQGFATVEALNNIAITTIQSLDAWAINEAPINELTFRTHSERLAT